MFYNIPSSSTCWVSTRLVTIYYLRSSTSPGICPCASLSLTLSFSHYNFFSLYPISSSIPYWPSSLSSFLPTLLRFPFSVPSTILLWPPSSPSVSLPSIFSLSLFEWSLLSLSSSLFFSFFHWIQDSLFFLCCTVYIQTDPWEINRSIDQRTLRMGGTFLCKKGEMNIWDS